MSLLGIEPGTSHLRIFRRSYQASFRNFKADHCPVPLTQCQTRDAKSPTKNWSGFQVRSSGGSLVFAGNRTRDLPSPDLSALLSSIFQFQSGALPSAPDPVSDEAAKSPAKNRSGFQVRCRVDGVGASG